MNRFDRTPRFPIVLLVLLLMAGVSLFAETAAGAGRGCCGGNKAAAADAGGCQGQGGGCCGVGRQSGRAEGRGYGRGAGRASGANHHETIHALLDHHEAIEREVKEIEGGVETKTTSKDPEVTRMIREHVRDMKQRVESGHGMRWWDPTFAEIFKHHEKIEMEIEEIEGGVLVRETSTDSDVALLIRQHAIRGVSEFVAAGRERAHRPTPLPDGYGADVEDEGTR